MDFEQESLQDCGPIRFTTSPEQRTRDKPLVIATPSSEPVAGNSTTPITIGDVLINQGASTLRALPSGPCATYAKVVAGWSVDVEADLSSSHIGPAPQPLRAFPGFPGQRAPQNQNTPLGTGRLQTTKLGVNSQESLE